MFPTQWQRLQRPPVLLQHALTSFLDRLNIVLRAAGTNDLNLGTIRSQASDLFQRSYEEGIQIGRYDLIRTFRHAIDQDAHLVDLLEILEREEALLPTDEEEIRNTASVTEAATTLADMAETECASTTTLCESSSDESTPPTLTTNITQFAQVLSRPVPRREVEEEIEI